MAIDTRDKRASALGIVLSVALTLPAADGALDQGDRQQVAFNYRGILAAAAVPIVPVTVFLEGGFGFTQAIVGADGFSLTVAGADGFVLTRQGGG